MHTSFTIKRFTFAEILIAVVIFLLLMTSVYRLFMSSSKMSEQGGKAVATLSNIRATISNLFFEIQECKKIVKPAAGQEGNWCVYKTEKDDYICLYLNDRHELIRTDMRLDPTNEHFDISSDFVKYVITNAKTPCDEFLKNLIIQYNNQVKKEDIEKFIYVLKNSSNWLTGKSMIDTIDKNKVVLENVSGIRFKNTDDCRLLTVISVFNEIKDGEQSGRFSLIDEVFLMNAEHMDRAP